MIRLSFLRAGIFLLFILIPLGPSTVLSIEVNASKMIPVLLSGLDFIRVPLQGSFATELSGKFRTCFKRVFRLHADHLNQSLGVGLGNLYFKHILQWFLYSLI